MSARCDPQSSHNKPQLHMLQSQHFGDRDRWTPWGCWPASPATLVSSRFQLESISQNTKCCWRECSMSLNTGCFCRGQSLDLWTYKVTHSHPELQFPAQHPLLTSYSTRHKHDIHVCVFKTREHVKWINLKKLKIKRANLKWIAPGEPYFRLTSVLHTSPLKLAHETWTTTNSSNNNWFVGFLSFLKSELSSKTILNHCFFFSF